MKKLRVLFVADVSPARVIGGAERVLHEQMRRLAQGGHEVHCLARTEGGEAAARMRVDGVVVHHFRGRSGSPVSFFLLSLWNCRREFNHLLAERSFDLLNFHQPLSALGVLAAPQSWKIPRLYTFHSLWFREYEIRMERDGLGLREGLPPWPWVWLNAWMRKIIERVCLKAAHQIVVLSEFSREQLLRTHRIPASKITLIPGGVDTCRFAPLPPGPERRVIRKELGVPEEASFLFTVRNLEPRMGLENLIEAMATIVAKAPRVYLIIGGAGSLERALRSLASRWGLERHVRFEGFIPEARLPDYYQAADLFLLPTRCLEGFGLVTVEALACGTPVLGTPVGGTIEILSELDPELLSRSPEPKEIAQKVLQFLSRSEAEWAALRQRCRQFALARYDWDRIAQKLLLHMEALVDKPW